MPRELSELEAREVSLVGKAANRRRFLVMKGDTEKMDEVKALQAIEKIDAAGNGDLIELLAAENADDVADLIKTEMSDEEKRRAVAAMRVMGADLAKKLLAKAEPAKAENDAKCPHCGGMNPTGAAMCKECGKPMTAKGVTKMAEIRKNDDGSYDLSAVPEDQRPAIEAVLKSADTREAALRADLQKAADEADKAKQALAKAEAEKELTAAIRKCEEFKGLPGMTPDDFAADLVTIRKALAPERYEKLCQMLKGAAAVVVKSGLLKESGASEGGEQTARAELNAKADELRKSDPKLTPEQARARVIKSDKVLAERVSAEDNARRKE